jgi:hypothetical protein
MKKLFMLILGAAMMPGFAFANAYDSSSSSALENESIDVYESQSMEDARAEEMR